MRGTGAALRVVQCVISTRGSVVCLRIGRGNFLLAKLDLSCEEAKTWSWASQEENIHVLWAALGLWGYCVLLSEGISSLLVRADQLNRSKGRAALGPVVPVHSFQVGK